MDLPENEAKFLEMTFQADKFEVVYAEATDIGDRGTFYESTGVIIDMFQSHLLQIAAMSLHECQLNDLKSCKARFIDSLTLIPESIVRGQYNGYRNHSGVTENSQTETFFKASFKSSLPEFENTVFSFTSGKALSNKEVSILISKGDQTHRICIQPNDSQRPDEVGEIKLSNPDGHAYSRLIHSFINKDHSYFVSLEEVEAQWRVTEQLLEAKENSELKIYESGNDWKEIS